MKHNQLISVLFLIHLLIGCTNIDEPPKVESPSEKSSYSRGVISPEVLDSTRAKQVSFFLYNLESSSEWKAQWDTISKAGTIPIDSIKIARLDTNEWYYILPVLNEDSLIGIVS